MSGGNEMLCEVPRDCGVSGVVALALLEAVETLGASSGELLRAANIDHDALRASDGWLTRAESYRLCELAIDLTRDSALGIHWAERLNAHSFTPISPLVEHAPTLRRAFEVLAEFHRLLTDKPGFDIIETGTRVTVRCARMASEPVRIERFVSEMLVTGMFRLIRSFGVHALKMHVQFAYEAPAYVEEYERVFEGAQHFEAPFTGLMFDRTLMDTAALKGGDDVHGALRTIAERRMLRLMRRTNHATRVCDLIVERGPGAVTDMKLIAKELGMGVHSLRRRLSEEGTTYRSLIGNARAILAKRLLLTTNGSIKEVAFELGFSDSTGFHRAFRRCTGMTPQLYRKHHAAGE